MSNTTITIGSWNVSGIRAVLKKADDIHLREFIENYDIDIMCLQETKLSHMSQIPTAPDSPFRAQWPYTYWSINPGTSQKKGLSGTAILSKLEPIAHVPQPEFDQEGRITTVEFEKFIVMSVYTPNSQSIDSLRFNFRMTWDNLFREFVCTLNNRKPVILCGDFNVVERECDYHSFSTYKNKAAGLYDIERSNFTLLKNSGPFFDAYTLMNPQKICYTFWSNFCKQRVNPGDGSNKKPNGWVLDYILCSESLRDNIVHSDRFSSQRGSDHICIYTKLII